VCKKRAVGKAVGRISLWLKKLRGGEGVGPFKELRVLTHVYLYKIHRKGGEGRALPAIVPGREAGRRNLYESGVKLQREGVAG